MSIQDLINSVESSEERYKYQVEWNELWERIAWLDAMECAGVDNWEGMDEARNLFQENHFAS